MPSSPRAWYHLAQQAIIALDGEELVVQSMIDACVPPLDARMMPFLGRYGKPLGVTESMVLNRAVLRVCGSAGLLVEGVGCKYSAEYMHPTGRHGLATS